MQKGLLKFYFGHQYYDKVLKRHGVASIDEKEYHRFTVYDTPTRFARHCGLSPGDETFQETGKRLGAEFDELYIALVSRETAPFFPGIAPLLVRLADAGVPLGCLTNAAVEYARAVLHVHGVAHLFGSVHGADDVPKPKPNPDGLR